MNGDQQYTEILAAINRLEISFTKTSQNFEDYKEQRKHIPGEVQAIKDRLNACNLECGHHQKETLSYFKKTDFLMTWYGRLAAAIFAFQFLIALMVLLGRIIDIEYTIRP